ncbi:MAG: RecX family transcriptional regulator [Sphingosinicella sp.]|nr:RecX family transcriptional regulator [Sphingosinicella sp.]
MPRPPLDSEALERLALFYAGRYATTRAKLRSYLTRKVRERGWEGGGQVPIESLVERFTELGYVNDRAFATAKGASLQRKGFGERRLDQALYAAGIESGDAVEAKESAQAGAFDAALRFAQRKRIGPYATSEPDRAVRARAFAAMIRAGHSTDLARKMVNSRAGEIPEPDEI